MSLILTPPPTVMVFFKEISLKNESTEETCSWDKLSSQHYILGRKFKKSHLRPKLKHN